MQRFFPILYLLFILRPGVEMGMIGQEQVHLSTDREIYFAGDLIWYRPWILREGVDKTTNTSRIVYIELLGTKNTIIVQQKADMRKSAGAGCFHIPDAAISGDYILRAYTNVNRNLGPESFFTKHILVINPVHHSPVFNEGSLPGSLQSEKVVANEGPSQNLDFRITGKDLVFRPGQAVDIEIVAMSGNKPAEAEFCASVALQLSTCPVNKGIADSFVHSQGEANTPDSTLYPEEIETDYISGYLEYDGKHLANQELYFSVPGESNMVMVSKTPGSGSFRFPVARIEGEHEILLSIPDSSKRVLLSLYDEFDPRYSREYNFQYCADSMIQESLNSAFLEWQIRRNYGLRNDSLAKQVKESFQFFGKPDADLNLKEYAELPNMEEVFFELVKQVMVIRRKKETSLAVIDRETNRTLGNHILYLVDGVPVFSPSEVLKLPPSQISRIHVVARRYYLGTAVFDGIIAITTRGMDRYSQLLPNFAAIKRLKFAIPATPSYQPEPLPATYPDFRTLLFWNSSLCTGKSGKATIHITIPDAPGAYQIMLEGFSKEAGAGRSYFEFRVVP
jgi:hypothetical protein